MHISIRHEEFTVDTTIQKNVEHVERYILAYDLRPGIRIVPLRIEGEVHMPTLALQVATTNTRFCAIVHDLWI